MKAIGRLSRGDRGQFDGSQPEFGLRGLPQSAHRSWVSRFWQIASRSTPAKISLVVLLILIVMMIFAPWIARYPPDQQNLLIRFQTPSTQHWLGTDELGRDIFSRIVYGSRISVSISLGGVAAGILAGILLGTIGGYFGGRIDFTVVWIIDLLLAFPGILLAVIIIAVLGSGLINVVVAIAIWSVPTFARLTRASVLSLKSTEFVEGARMIGAGHFRIATRYLLANSLGPLIVFSTLRIATAILTVAALGFLGLGIAPPTPEWGSMVASGRVYILSSPHLIYMPGLAIFFTVMALNSLGDTLQDTLDPKAVGREVGSSG